MSAKLGELKRLDPRTVWPTEARDFTPWLADNISELADVLGMDLEVTATEAPVGDFFIDILAKDLASGRNVVIENQFGQTDHDHLGKLLTYASAINAYGLVWISESVRDEHRQALEWLNERTDNDTMLFAIELEILQIDQSPPAHNFKSIVFPNKWQKSAHTSSTTAPSSKGETYRKYFQELIDRLRTEYRFTGARVAFAQNWFGFASGMSGVIYSASFAQGGRARTEIYFDRGEAEDNKQLFDWLTAKRGDIEGAFGSPLEWERLDSKKSCRIAIYRQGSIDSDEAALSEIKNWHVANLLKFKQVFGPLLQNYSGKIPS